MTKLQDKFQSIATELKSEFFERDHIIEAALAAVLASQHMLQIGVPGTAKSALTNALCRRIEGGNYFEWLLTRFSTPEELFGPVSLKSLEKDEYKRVTTRKLPEAHIAFIDEIFKGNAAILNSMLTAINERQFDNGPSRMKIPLVSVFGASNELPEERELDALFDRFILRFDVQYLKDGQNWEALMRTALPTVGKGQVGTVVAPTVVTLNELEQAQADVMHVEFPADTVRMMYNIKMTLDREGLVASDRRWKQTMRVIQAWAWLHGRDKVADEDLELLCDMLWREPNQRPALVEVIMNVTNPLNLEATKIYDECRSVYSQWDKDSTSATQEVIAKLKSKLDDIDKKLKIADPKKTAKLLKMQEVVKGWYRNAVDKMEL